ncbi:MAG TPA: hypothetical protein VK994_05460, partial [Bacteroidales bacterium]|nr:hypothetical protein [Bacteroidales bacterium]
MNKISKSLALVSLMGFIYACNLGPDPAYLDEINAYHVQMNKEFADSATSPLTPEGLAGFHSLEFFPVDDKYCI